jgi:hypothetical protein
MLRRSSIYTRVSNFEFAMSFLVACGGARQTGQGVQRYGVRAFGGALLLARGSLAPQEGRPAAYAN